MSDALRRAWRRLEASLDAAERLLCLLAIGAVAVCDERADSPWGFLAMLIVAYIWYQAAERLLLGSIVRRRPCQRV